MSTPMRLAGINTGLDTEGIIKQMMSTYQNKIDKQNKKLQTLTWQQTQYRDITSKLTSFKSKYFDILKRDSYLLSPNTFKKLKTNITTKSGKESGLKVSTATGAAEGSHKIKIEQTATAAELKGKQIAPENFKLDIDQAISHATPDADNKLNFSLDVRVGNVTKTVDFSTDNLITDGMTDAEKANAVSAMKTAALESLNTGLEKFGKTSAAGDYFVQAEIDGSGKLAFKTSGNAAVTVTEKSGNFGLTQYATKVAVDPAAALTGTSSIAVTIPNHYTGDPVTKNISFNTVSSTYFDGRSSDASVNEAFLNLKKAAFRTKYGISDDTEVTEAQMNSENFIYSSADAAYDLNKQSMLNALNGAYAFEQGISFNISGSSMTAKFMDGSDVEFTLTSTCDATFGLRKGSATNSLSESTKLKDMGFATEHFDDGDFYTLDINGVNIKVGEKATIGDLMKAVNSSDAGVTMTYSKLEGSFNIKANDMGSGGQVSVGSSSLADSLGLTGGTRTDGQNAIINIDGTEIYHNANTYEMDGVTYDFTDVDPAENDIITVGIEKDTDSVKETIKSFVEDYNTLIDEINEYIYTARPQDSKKNYYDPLSDEDKEAMSDKEVEKWEEMAQKGLLYHDSTVMTIMSQIRTALYSSVETEDGKKFGLYSMGITTSSVLDDRGKLKIDEDKLNKAFENNFDDIVKLFTDSESSVMKKVSNVIDSAVKDTGKVKGTLIRKAGLEKGMSATDNAIYKEMERIKKRVSQLQTRYDKKEEYWWKVFTNLEKMQNTFNEQQNYLQNFLANGGMMSSQ